MAVRGSGPHVTDMPRSPRVVAYGCFALIFVVGVVVGILLARWAA